VAGSTRPVTDAVVQRQAGLLVEGAPTPAVVLVLLPRVRGHLLGDLQGDRDDAVTVADDDVPGLDLDAPDRHRDAVGLVLHAALRHRLVPVLREDRHALRDALVVIAGAARGDDRRGALDVHVEGVVGADLPDPRVRRLEDDDVAGRELGVPRLDLHLLVPVVAGPFGVVVAGDHGHLLLRDAGPHGEGWSAELHALGDRHDRAIDAALVGQSDPVQPVPHVTDPQALEQLDDLVPHNSLRFLSIFPGVFPAAPRHGAPRPSRDASGGLGEGTV